MTTRRRDVDAVAGLELCVIGALGAVAAEEVVDVDGGGVAAVVEAVVDVVAEREFGMPVRPVVVVVTVDGDGLVGATGLVGVEGGTGVVGGTGSCERVCSEPADSLKCGPIGAIGPTGPIGPTGATTSVAELGAVGVVGEQGV